jgi:hypothetical protein
MLIHQAPTSWDSVADVPEAYKALAMLRRTNPMLGRIAPEDLTWSYQWSEGFAPLDMDLPEDIRARYRAWSVRELSIGCAKGRSDAVYQMKVPKERVLHPSFMAILIAMECSR